MRNFFFSLAIVTLFVCCGCGIGGYVHNEAPPLEWGEEDLNMAATAPPRGYDVNTGTIGTDIDASTSPALSNRASVHFKNTATASKLITQDFLPWEGGEVYEIGAWVRADSAAAGNQIYAAVLTYQGDQTTPVATDVIINTAVSAANTWEYHRLYVNNPAARWYRILFGKNTSTAFNAYIDSVVVKRVPRSFQAYNVLGGTLTAGVATKISIDTFTSITPYGVGFTPHDIVGIFDEITNFRFTADKHTLVYFTAGLRTSNIVNGESVQLDLYKNGGLYGRIDFFDHSGTSTRAPILRGTYGPVHVQNGDYFELYATFTGAGSVTVLTGQLNTFFSMFEIR